MGPGMLAGILITSGILLAVYGFSRQPVNDTPKPARRRKRRSFSLTPVERRNAIIAFGAALVFTLLTGWVVSLLVAPVLTVLFPRLFASTGKEQLEKLDALGEWTRSLAGVLVGRNGLVEAIAATLESTPPILRPHVERLVARLRTGQSPATALHLFADDVDDRLGDLIAGALTVSAQESGGGLHAVLNNLSESVSTEIRLRREIETERSSPRKTVRALGIVTVVMAVAFIFGTEVGEFYLTPAGQVVLLGLTGLFVLALAWMRQISKTPPTSRFLPYSDPPSEKKKVREQDLDEELVV